jgi:beta/gamma crystallin
MNKYLLACLLVANGAAAADLTLYAEDDYQGRGLGVVIDEKQLGVLNFDDRASSVVVENGTWILCSGEEYSGECITLEPGRYASLQALGLDNAVTSVRRRDPANVGTFGRIEAAPKGSQSPRPAPQLAGDIVLYAANDYSGASQLADESQADVRADLSQGKANSTVIAAGTWELCDDTFYRGQCVTLGPGKYPSMEHYGLTRGVASARRASDAPHRAGKTPGN